MLILLTGCGSIRQRHIRNLIALNAGDIIAHDISQERLSGVAREYRDRFPLRRAIKMLRMYEAIER